MEMTVTLQQEAISTVSSGLQMNRKSLEMNLQHYEQQLAVLETQHSMTSEQFEYRFNAGELGDDAIWFEWEYVLDICCETTRQLSIVEDIRL